MYPIQSAAKALFDAEQRQVIRITGVDKNGTPINITEANIMQDGFSIDRYSCNGKKLEIGTAIASELSLKLDNRLGQFDNIYFEGAELFVEIGVVNWGADPVDWTTNANQTVTTNNGEKIQFDISNAIYWIPCGYYTPDEQPRRLSTISLKALDRMTKFDIVQHALLPWTDNNGNVMTDNELNPFYFCTELSFPTTIQGLVEQACFVCGVPLETDLSTLPGHNIAIASMPVLQGVITFRNLIQWCAGIMATNAWIDWDGKLRFSWYNNNTGYTSTIENRFDSDLYENDIQITGVVFTDIDEDKTLYIAGTDTYALDLSGNALISAESAQVILNGVYEIVHNYAYRPFTASVVTAPYLWPMDRITFTDKGGSGHVTTLTNVNFTINNNTTIASVGETIQTNSYASPNSFTSEQASILQKMRRVGSEDLHNAVDNATAQITGANGGYIRYIYDDNGILTETVIMDTDDIATATKVWRWNSGGLGYSENGYAGPYTLAMTQDGAIVADFITAGTMSADLIRAGILTDTEGNNYWDLDNGIFRLAGNSTLGGTSVNQILSDVAATISSVDIEFAQNQSTTVAPTSGWSTDAPSWAAGYYIWQRTKTVSPSGVTYSEPTCISGRDGSASTPGLNQATIYLYQRAATQPSKPSVATTYTFVGGTLSPVPEGWYRYIPNGNEPCWVTLASAISTESTDNIPASEWVTPTKLVQDGANGSSVDTVVDYFAVGNTTTPPNDTEFWTAGIAAPWMDNYGNIIMTSSANEIDFMPPAVPVPTETDPYIWQYQLTTYTDGSTSKSSKYISSVLGETGVGVSDITEQYYLSTSDVAQVSGEWSTEQPVWVVGTFIWMRTIVTWTDGEVTITTPILAKAINGANTYANDAIDVANSAVEHTNNLDASLDQYGVFNRLTNNGEVQGIFLEDNKLYLNGTYMRTGILDASAVDVVNLNAANITTGTLDAARIGANTISISQLTNNAQTALVGGSTSKTQYYLSTSSSSATGGSWGDTVPTWSSGKYVWTRVATTVTKADGTTTSTTYSTAVYDANLTSALSTASTALSDAATAQSTANSAVGSASVKTQYYLSTSSSTATGGSWSDTVPTWSSGKYVWTRVATTVTPISGSAATTYKPSANGQYDSNLTNALSTAYSALSNANTAQSTADSAAYREQIIYISKVSSTASIAANTTWVSDASGNQDTWTTKRPVYSSDYPVLFVATQHQTMAQLSGNTCSCTAPMIDQTTTVIDGGHITTGSINAGFIRGGTLLLGGNADEYGIFTIKDNANNIIGKWNKDGIFVNSGEIKLGKSSDDYYININQSPYPLVAKSAESIGYNAIYFEVGPGFVNISDASWMSGHPSVHIKKSGIINLNGNNNCNTEISPYGINIYKSGTDTFYYFGTPYSANPSVCLIGDTTSNISTYIRGNLTVSGTKSREVNTSDYSGRLLYCYETPTPLFGDVGEGVISDDGLCYVTLDAVFAQTVTTSQYQVFLQKYGDGDCWVKARNSAYFIIQGTPGLAFGWEIKAKQRNFDQLRLEKSESKIAPPMQTYGQDAAEYIKNLEDGRIPA